MGIYSERLPSFWQGFLILFFSFVLIYGLWMTPARELFRQEGLYAAAAVEGQPGLNMPVHGVEDPRVFPLLPLLAGAVCRSGILPMESILRLISLFFLGAGALIVYSAAAARRSTVAGSCAAAMYISTVLTIDKGVNGDPVIIGAFFLLAAQMIFFRLGVRNSKWNTAWILTALFLTAGYLACGITVPLFFIVSCFFFRRPLSVKSKLKLPGFYCGAVLLGGVFLLRNTGIFDRGVLPLELMMWEGVSVTGYLLDTLSFLPYLVIRLLPWCLICWLPFCVAQQSLDSTPVMGLYLRTLTFVALVLLWFLPGHDSRYIIFLLGPLAILTGRSYELGMRRYGRSLRKVLLAAPVFVAGMIPAIAVACFVPERWLTPFVSVSNSLGFRNAPGFTIFAGIAIVLMLIIAAVLYFDRKREPVWLVLLLVALAIGIFNSVILLPYRTQEQEKRIFGSDLRRVITADAGKEAVIYTMNIKDLHGGLFYSGFPVRDISSAVELPGGGKPVVYLLSTSFPAVPERSWSNLLPVDYRYRSRKVSLWRGVWRELEKDSR